MRFNDAQDGMRGRERKQGRTREPLVEVVDGRVRVDAAEAEVFREPLARDVVHLHGRCGVELR